MRTLIIMMTNAFNATYSNNTFICARGRATDKQHAVSAVVCRAQERLKKGAHMDRALSFFISAGIAALGVWIVAHAGGSESPLVWTLLGILPIVVGSISLYQAIREARRA
jgi:hypothetical protein